MYFEKYGDLIKIHKRVYFFYLKEWVKKKKAEMSFKRRISFYFYKKTKGFDYSVARPSHPLRLGLKNYNARKLFDYEIKAYRKKHMFDEDYDKPEEQKKIGN